MKRLWKATMLGAVVAVAACSTDRSATTAPQAPSALQADFEHRSDTPGQHVSVMLTRPRWDARELGFSRTGSFSRTQGTGISYHGGPIFYTPRIAAIYWAGSTIYSGGPAPGATGTGAQDGSLVGFFLNNLGGSPYWNINNTYTDGGTGRVANSLGYTQFWAANTNVPASGSTVSDAAVQAQVVAGLTSGALTYDASTLYAVFSGPGVNLGGGFGTQYCAYHGHFSWNGHDVKYAVMPHDIDYPSACTAGSAPNGDPGADAEVNTLAHETEETATDEDLNAWYDNRGKENADKCAWNFGTTFSTAGGAANVVLGGKNFLIQQNWVNAGSGGCVLKW
jgi:hypothetical protein